MVWKTKMALMGIPITKGLPYGIFMKQIIFEITENGQLNRLVQKWTVPKPDCRPLHKEGKPLSLEKMISLFIISMIGILIAIIIIIIENVFHVYKPRKSVCIKEANKMKLQRFFMKLQNNLNDEVFFHESPITTMRTLLKEIQDHIDSLIDAEGGDKSTEKEILKHEIQDMVFDEPENTEIPENLITREANSASTSSDYSFNVSSVEGFFHEFSDPVQDAEESRKNGKETEHDHGVGHVAHA